MKYRLIQFEAENEKKPGLNLGKIILDFDDTCKFEVNDLIGIKPNLHWLLVVGTINIDNCKRVVCRISTDRYENYLSKKYFKKDIEYVCFAKPSK